MKFSLRAKALAAAALCAALAVFTAAPCLAASAAASQSASVKQLLTQMKQEARLGKAVDIPFAVKSTVIDTVEAKWGKPTSSQYIASAMGIYNVYAAHSAVFGFNKGDQIFEVRSSAHALSALSYNAVRSAYGKPAYVHTSSSQVILGYVVTSEYKMLLVFPAPSKKNPNPSLLHYSVFYLQGTVNLMAGNPGRSW